MIDGTPEEVVAVTAAFAIPFAFLLGAIIGSFLNVVIWRVPNGMSIVRPPSACPECGHAIRGYDNIPILSWFILRGRCRDCGAPISPRYPIIEAVTSLAFAGIAALAVVGGVPWPLVPALLWFAGISIALTMIDLDVHRLPNAIVLPSYPVLVALLALASWLTGDWWALLHAAIGGAAMLLLYVVIVLVAPRGMGLGDVKLAGVIGLVLGWIGWGTLIVGGFGAFLLGGLFGVVLLLFRRAGRRTAIPFGPWMLLAAWLAIPLGQGVAEGYLRLVGLV